MAKPLEQFAGKALLEDLHDDRVRGFVGLADEKMNVLGHDHVASHDKTVTMPCLFQDEKEQVAALCCSEQGTALVATESDEVEIACVVTAPETGGHGEILR